MTTLTASYWRSTRLLEHIEVGGDGCWTWSGRRHTGGYGLNGETYAHRFSYETLVAPISVGFELDHLCRNRLCVRPSHLEAVTHAENVARGMSPNAGVLYRAGKCIRGHDRAVNRMPCGYCRECGRIRAAARRHRLRAAAAS